jgi:hypothetical protein
VFLLAATARRLGLPPGHSAELAVVLLLLYPRIFYLLERAWTEPFLSFAIAFCAWAVAGQTAFLIPIGLALVMASKQYGLLWVPSLLAARVVRGRDVLIGAVIAFLTALPFIVWDYREFWFDTVLFQFYQPFRHDALSISSLVAQATGWQVPSSFGFAAALATIALSFWCRRSGLATAAFSGAAVLLAFFLFNKQAFFNYYWLTSVLLILAAISSAAESVRGAGTDRSLTRERTIDETNAAASSSGIQKNEA